NTRPSRLIEPCQLGFRAETLIMESTYGAKTDRHPSLKDESNRIVHLMQETLDNGGKVLVPTFAIGRGQEVLFMLENYMRSGLLEKVPIYLDGMVNKALRIYRHNAMYLKREVQLRILSSDDDPFKSEQYFTPQRKDRSDVLEQEKCIILATSGMLNGGPVLTYLRHLAPDEKNLLMLSGFQAKGTRGRELSEGAKELNIDGDLVPINLKVEQAQLSGHSDHEGLVQFARSVEGLKRVFLVHSEPEKGKELSKELAHLLRGVEVVLPKLGETIRL
ncbi:MAG TPA: MBL fold metallo-hydrolase RNA specificity domain-containing protein, partial [Candidatus Norongarragalinales archaeon]|nr:MBL fold metallo-hydrolase RNA specificity domain-containing protein [Candidatus Norongarragalinales archaeon]